MDDKTNQIASLKSRDKAERDAQIAALLEMDPATLSSWAAELVAPLVNAARWGHHYFEEPSRSAVQTLIKLGTPAVEPLLARLEDGNYARVHIACIALAQMPDEAAASAAWSKLTSYLERSQPWPNSQAAIRAMAEIGDQQTVDLLSTTVLETHPNGMVRREAAKALGAIGDKRAIPALTKALKDQDGNVRFAAQDALAQLGQ